MLIENLHSYVDRILTLLIENTISNSELSIDDILLKKSLDLSEHLSRLNKNKKNGDCNSENYILYLFNNY